MDSLMLLLCLVVLGTTIWVGIDSSANKVTTDGKPPSFMNGAFAWVLACILLWIVAFPFYLVKRSQHLKSQSVAPAAPVPDGLSEVPAPSLDPTVAEPAEGATNKTGLSTAAIVLIPLGYSMLLAALIWIGVIPAQSAGLFTWTIIIPLVVVVYIDGKKLGAGAPGDVDEKGKKRTGAGAWAFATVLLALIVFPWYLASRRHYGAKNLAVVGLGTMFAALLIPVAALMNPGAGPSFQLFVDKRAAKVRDSSVKACPDRTLGKMADSFLSHPKWEYGKSSSGDEFVNLTGGMSYLNRPAEVLVQFNLTDGGSGFEVGSIEINGIPQMRLMAVGLLQKMCKAAGGAGPGDDDDSSSRDRPSAGSRRSDGEEPSAKCQRAIRCCKRLKKEVPSMECDDIANSNFVCEGMLDAYMEAAKPLKITCY